MRHRPAPTVLKLVIAALMAVILSGCLIYVDHDEDLEHRAPVDEKPAQTGSF